jgi:hypothetical protein
MTKPRHYTQNPCSGHFECYRDFAPVSLCYSRRAFQKVSSFEQTAIDEFSESFRTSDLLDVTFCFTKS